MKYFFLITYTILFIFGCNSQPKNIVIKEQPMNWTTIKIPSETGANSFDYRFNQYFILDRLTGFIIGNNSIAEMSRAIAENRLKKRENYKMVLFKTEDGGINFKRIALGKGSLEKMVSDSQKNLYVLKRVYGIDSTPDSFEILTSKDVGETWQEINFSPSKKIVTIQFYNNLIGVVSVFENSKDQLYKTSDGGKTWKELIVKTRGIDLLGVQFKNENELFTFRETTDFRQSATINFTTGDCQVYDPSLKKGYAFSGMFRDDSTRDLYSLVTNPDEKHNLQIYNHVTKKLKVYNFVNDIESNLVFGVNVSDNFIGVLREDHGRTHYYYSNDYGENWMQENLPDDFVTAKSALYGKGLVWVRSGLKLYDFQVRKSAN